MKIKKLYFCSIKNNTDLELSTDKLNEALCECIRHHQMIIKSCELLENISSPFILIKSIEISLQLCVLALTLKVNEKFGL